MKDNNIISTEDFIRAAGSNNLYQDACAIIDSAKRYAYKQVDETLVKRNWLLGLRIQHEVLKDKRAEYGKQVIKELSKSLTQRYGEGFKPANLYHFVSFYNSFRNIFYAVNGKSGTTPQYGKCDGKHNNLSHLFPYAVTNFSSSS